MLITSTNAYTTSAQARQYLLCVSCEQRFNHQGERWVLANGLQEDGKTFPLYEFLKAQQPIALTNPIPGIHVYELSSQASFRPDALAYVACSVIWRAGVSSWRNCSGQYPIPLGPYEEILRSYLIGATPFPGTARVNVMVRRPGKVAHWTMLPEMYKDPFGCRVHRFTIPGFAFFVQLSNRPDEPWDSGCIMHNRRNRILVTATDLYDDALISGIRTTTAGHQPKKGT